MITEPRMQPKFRMMQAVSSLGLFAAATLAHPWFLSLPDREEEGPAVRELHLMPIAFAEEGFAPLRLVGAWRLTSDDGRFGGVSGLATDGDELVAISDSSVVLRFPKVPRRRSAVRVNELPAGPGDGRLKRNRDSEALAADPQGRGWWVPFENRNELWLYDRGFRQVIERHAIPEQALGKNKGVEGLTSANDALLLFAENGRRVLRLESKHWTVLPTDFPVRLADASSVGEGVLILQRQLTWRGFRNTLAFLQPQRGGLRTVWRESLPVAWYDNIEAIAAEPSGEGYRMWMMSDDNFHPRLRTILLVVDIPKELVGQP